MDVSFLIVTRQRPDDLRLTLSRLNELVDIRDAEVLVFIDGCRDTLEVKKEFPMVRWFSSETQLGASPARRRLYPEANGRVLIGLDDDAHPVTSDFLSIVDQKFRDNTLGILVFREIKGIFPNDRACLDKAGPAGAEYRTADFIGSGFAIRSHVYHETRGFPEWIDIYGEETCVAFEVLENGYDLLYVPSIVINHRVDMEKRRRAGRNYFRFERQLRNSFFIFLVYYRHPFRRMLRLLLHNFRKYAVRDRAYFSAYCRAMAAIVWRTPAILRFRKPVSAATEDKIKRLNGIPY